MTDKLEEEYFGNKTPQEREEMGLVAIDHSDKTYELVTPTAALHSVRFWQYFGMMLCANIFGGTFSY